MSKAERMRGTHRDLCVHLIVVVPGNSFKEGRGEEVEECNRTKLQPGTSRHTYTGRVTGGWHIVVVGWGSEGVLKVSYKLDCEEVDPRRGDLIPDRSCHFEHPRVPCDHLCVCVCVCVKSV